MIETERIIKKGIIDSYFLQEETRNDYTISVKMKKVWAIELDLLEEFSKICLDHNFTFWVGFGTLLGAVRHHGFIPWDDDLDIWMPREDYDRLLSLNLKLEAPYFFQTTMNDEDYYSSFARLRNSNTTGILVSKNNKCNNGIYIDIYPIDATETNYIEQWIKSKRIKIKNVCAHAYMYNINPNPITKLIHWFLHLPFVKYNARKTYMSVNKMARKRWDNAEKVGLIVFTPYEHSKNIYNKNDFLDSIILDFENIKVPVPIGYKNILSTIYGDYMKFPPIEKRGNWHKFIFEPDISYKEYLQCMIESDGE